LRSGRGLKHIHGPSARRSRELEVTFHAQQRSLGNMALVRPASVHADRPSYRPQHRLVLVECAQS
jgi:hypothetical protein